MSIDTQQSDLSSIERATRAVKENRWADAITDLRKAHERVPNDFDIWGQLGFAYSRNGQYAAAVTTFEGLAAKKPTDPKWPYMVGYQHYQQKDWARAIHCFDEALALRPAYVKVLYRKGYAHLALGEEEKAIKAFCECIGSWERMTGTAQEHERPSYGKAQFQLGKTYLKRGWAFKSRRHLQTAAQIDSHNHDVLYELGQCYLKLDQLDEALLAFQSADRIKGGVDYVLDRLAQVYARKGDYAKAGLTYRRIPERRRRSFILQHMGMLYLQQGNHEEALRYLEAAAKKQSDNHNIHYALARAQEAVGQFRAAHASCVRAVSLRKTKYKLEFKEAQEALKRIAQMLQRLPAPDPNAKPVSTEGIVQSYNETRGFGFISSESEPRIFFHVSSFAGRQKPREGSRVTCTLEATSKGPRAARVVLVES
jgi:tetratricopeptide (TPR) repeat protein